MYNISSILNRTNFCDALQFSYRYIFLNQCTMKYKLYKNGFFSKSHQSHTIQCASVCILYDKCYVYTVCVNIVNIVNSDYTIVVYNLGNKNGFKDLEFKNYLNFIRWLSTKFHIDINYLKCCCVHIL